MLAIIAKLSKNVFCVCTEHRDQKPTLLNTTSLNKSLLSSFYDLTHIIPVPFGLSSSPFGRPLRYLGAPPPDAFASAPLPFPMGASFA